jgi:hypothetical protein
MQVSAGLKLLTTAEAAQYLLLKERNLYEWQYAKATPAVIYRSLVR